MEKKTKDISDIALATYLSIIHHKLVGLNQSGKRILFSFEGSDALEKSILDFYNRIARVDPLSFSETLRNFKSLVKNREGGF